MNTSPLDETIRTAISKRLIQLCGEREITFAHAAEQAGIDPSTLSRWCSPKHRTPPQVGPLIALTDYFEVTLDWLSGRSDERNPGQDVASTNHGSTEHEEVDILGPAEPEAVAARAAAIRQAKEPKGRRGLSQEELDAVLPADRRAERR